MSDIKKLLESFDKIIKEWPDEDDYGMSPDTIGSYLENANWHYAGRIEDEVIYTSPSGLSKIALSDYGWSYIVYDVDKDPRAKKVVKDKKSGSSTRSFFQMLKNRKKPVNKMTDIRTDEDALLNKPVVNDYSFTGYLGREEKIPNQSPVLGGKPKKPTSKFVGGCAESKGK
jgi:NADH:ubiquinone oxidoreductase subunit